jgi:mannose-6-phosphate isomerase-like protein (cupin superfamily)
MSILNTDHRSASNIRYAIGERDTRPWGTWEVLATGDRYTVKRISVLPGERLSLQYHRHRSEHWTIVQGYAEVELDGVVHQLSPGKHVHIPVGMRHRVRALGSELLVFLEVQSGDILDENDIVRISDDYGRLEPEGSRESAGSSFDLLGTGHSTWVHFCAQDRSWFRVNAGEECNWCGKRESDSHQVDRISRLSA